MAPAWQCATRLGKQFYFLMRPDWKWQASGMACAAIICEHSPTSITNSSSSHLVLFAALVFWSIGTDGRFDPKSLHGSCPVIKACVRASGWAYVAVCRIHRLISVTGNFTMGSA